MKVTMSRRVSAFFYCALAGLVVGVLWSGFNMPATGNNHPVEPIAVLRMLVIAPLIEELAFRGGVQSGLGYLFRNKAISKTSISIQNILTSILFAGFHIPTHSYLMAAFIVVPSLVFGYLKDAFGGLTPPILMHCWYNVIFLLIVAA